MELDILIPAFIAGLLVLTTHIPLGMKVLARGVIFADIAIAQIAGLGVIIASMLNFTAYPLLVQLTAAASAIGGAALLSVIEHYFDDVKEACIGLTFVLAACAGILLLSHDVHGAEHLKDLLVGQILWVSTQQLIATAVLSAALLLFWQWRRATLGRMGFYGIFALAVTASVQLVGVYLVFASLIVPALTTHHVTRHRLAYAYFIGIIGYAIGLYLSEWMDLPSGAAIVWSMALVGGVVALGLKLWVKSPSKLRG